MRIFQLLEEKIVRFLFDKYAIYNSTKKVSIFFSRENYLLPWSEHRNIEAGM